MITPTVLNVIGLSLDIGGAALMFLFPPPPDLIDSGVDPIGPAEKFRNIHAERRRIFRRNSAIARWAMLAIAIGFGLQLVATLGS